MSSKVPSQATRADSECVQARAVSWGRLQAKARCQDIENELERMGHRLCALKEGVWTPTIEIRQKAIALREGQLQTEHASLEQAIALPDAEFLRLLGTIATERQAA